MNKIAFFDTKPYDEVWFNKLKEQYGVQIKYFEAKLGPDTSVMAKGCQGVVAFVNDDLSEETIDSLVEQGIGAVALRCAGYNNVNLKHAEGKLRVFTVPAYSPNAVAEHAMALLLCLNRKIHRAYNRVREYNFSIKGLIGFDLKGKTIGVVGTGRIGQEFIEICKGFRMKVIACDPYPVEMDGVEYVELEELFRESDVIALHCPLTVQNYHMINKKTLGMMKDGVYIINTSRGALINAEALLDAIKTGKVAGAGLDVYEEESDLFFEDASDLTIHDDVLKLLLSTPNVLITSHQAFFTEEALSSIAEVTLQNLRDYFDGNENKNEVIYKGK